MKHQYSTRAVIGGILAGIPSIWYVLRWSFSFFADLNDAPEGLSRFVAAIRLPGPDFFNSGWFALGAVALGLWLIWSGRANPEEIESRLKLDNRLNILDQKLRMSLFYAIQLLGEIQQHILRDCAFPESEYHLRFKLYHYRIRTYTLVVEMFRHLAQQSSNRVDPATVDEILIPAYQSFVELDFLITGFQKRPESNFNWGGVTPVVYKDEKKALEHLLNVAWGQAPRERIEANVIAKIHQDVIDHSDIQ